MCATRCWRIKAHVSEGISPHLTTNERGRKPCSALKSKQAPFPENEVVVSMSQVQDSLIHRLEARVLAHLSNSHSLDHWEPSEHDHTWRALVDAFPHPVALFDRQLRHVYANHAT